MAKFFESKKRESTTHAIFKASTPNEPSEQCLTSPVVSTFTTISEDQEGIRTALGGTSTHTTIKDHSLWKQIDITNTAFKYAYKYGIAISEDFMSSKRLNNYRSTERSS
jgi:hypothetical protein